MNDEFALGLFATAIGSAFMFLIALIARRLERHLDRQDGRLNKIERMQVAMMVRLGLSNRDLADIGDE